MATNKIQIEDHNGDIYYPHTSADVVKRGTSTVDADLKSVENKFNAQGAALGAVQLTTPRTINGTSFNGTANITTDKWGAARNLALGKATKPVDGSGNISYTLAEMGAVQFEYSTDSVVNGARIPTIFADNSQWFMTRSGGILPPRHEAGYVGTPTRSFYDINTVHLNAKHVGGHANNQRWDIIPVVNNQGVMEVGRYIDFHNSRASIVDYGFRFDNNANGSCVYYGTLAQHSDRRLKENISYIDDIMAVTKDVKENVFKEFIREMKFVTYNYKNAETPTFGFIAQDIEEQEVAGYMLREYKTEAFNEEDADENGEATYKVFDIMAYTSVIAKALQEEIKSRDTQIKELEERVQKLEAKIN